MHVIRHDHIAPDCATVTVARALPFLDQNRRPLIREDRLALIRARGHEVNRSMDRDALQPSQVFVHAPL